MSSERRISVRAGEEAYEVVIRPGLLDDVARLLGTASRKAVIVADETVAALYLDRVAGSLRTEGIEVVAATFPAGEAAKSLHTLQDIYDRLLAAGIERSTPLLGLGGGVTTDLAGFAAATLLRGLPYVPVPTSLLAMVDAAIGGKTGVNHPLGKNLIGAFHQPGAVLIDPEVLHTLPPRELRNGLAEVIKHYLIRDAAGFARLEARIAAALKPHIAFLTDVIAENVAIKASVVEADPFEQNVRAHLNFGHTFGHAFERASDYAISHGEAVALGMCAAMHAAVDLGMVDESTRQRVVALVTAAGLPTRTHEVSARAAVQAMRSDKKVKDGRLRLVLPERIGSVVVRNDVPEAVLRGAVDAVTG